jgi:hypothetical protein
MLFDQILMWCAAIIAVGAAIGVLRKLLKPILTRLHAAMDFWEEFSRDWAGEEKAPGRSAVPGVMERLNRIDGELKRNGGSSMKDSISRIEQTQTKILNRLEEGNQRFADAEERLDRLEKGKN